MTFSVIHTRRIYLLLDREVRCNGARLIENAKKVPHRGALISNSRNNNLSWKLERDFYCPIKYGHGRTYIIVLGTVLFFDNCSTRFLVRSLSSAAVKVPTFSN